MKGLMLVAALAAALAVPTTVRADSIGVGDQVRFGPGGSRFSNGGEYILTDVTSGDSFVTFCLETDEHLNFKDTFLVGALSDQSVGGGSKAFGGPNPDPLDIRTKAVYHYFRGGSSGWLGIDVQKAIWSFEQEIAATSNVVTLWAGANAVAYDFGDEWVQVVQLVDREGARAQDVLSVNVHAIPEPGSMLLFGSALFGLAGVARRRRAR